VTSDNNTSFSDNSEIEQNTSKVAIVPRQPNQPRALYGVAGNPIWVSSDGQQFTGNSKRCTLGFAIRNHGTRQFITHGFLTLGNCVHNRRVDSNGVFSYHASQQDPGQIEAVRIGIVAPLDFTQGRFGLNYAFVRLRPNSDQEIFWDDDTSTLIPIRGGFANVVNNYFVPSRNDRVCYYGGYSGHVCGWVVNPSTPLVRFSPWTREVSFRGFNFRLPLEFFLDLIKVRPDVIPIAMTDRVEHDSGAPVYSPIIGDNRQITAARPVGILLGYNAEYEDTGTRCELVRYMYCVSLARIFLDNNPDLRLIGTPHH
jgi:hypothetical protein